jgi:DNA-binding transcriptional MerR regulator
MAARKLRKEKSADALRSIGEAARELDLQAHVLRYWETKFPKHVKPIKRADGRRMFRRKDLEALRAIQILVHERGMTLKGAKAILTEQGVETVLNGDARLVATPPVAKVEIAAPASSPARDLQQAVSQAFGASLPESSGDASGSTERLQSVLVEMTDLKRRLDEMRAKRAA